MKKRNQTPVPPPAEFGTRNLKIAGEKAVDAEAVKRLDTFRFGILCEEEMTRCRTQGYAGIGTMQEKRMHRILKCFIHPNEDYHEVGVQNSRFVSDVRIGNAIFEVQTGKFAPLRKKIGYYLTRTDCTVTVVHPIPVVRWLTWINPADGSVSPRRKVSHGKLADLLPELNSLAPYLGNPRLRFKVLLLEVEDFRLLNGRSEDRKKGATKYERLPLALLDEEDFADREDFRRLIPEDLPSPFTVKEFSRLTKLRGRDAYAAVRALAAVGLFAPAEPIGRAMAFSRVGG